MKKHNVLQFISLICILIWGTPTNCIAQRDIIYKNDSTQIRCKILNETSDHYKYAYLDSLNSVLKATMPKSFIDSVKYNFYDSNLVTNKLFYKKAKLLQQPVDEQEKVWQFTLATGLNLGNILEYNSPSGTDKKSFSATLSLDAGINYMKQNSRFEMTNELHWLFSLQKSGLTGAAHIQRVSDDISTLHDLSIAIGKNRKLSFNMIAKAGTSVFNIYNGEYFKDINSLGKEQCFLSPYDITVSPGIKWQADKYLRISVSPYSFNLYGVKNQQVSNTGVFITETNASGNYKKFLFKRLGAEVNIWYDRKIKKWLELQYRFGISANYFENITRNAMIDGLFLTRFRLIKDLYLMHRATIQGDYGIRPFKPYYQQSILLSFQKNF